jgi:hypothetical protein
MSFPLPFFTNSETPASSEYIYLDSHQTNPEVKDLNAREVILGNTGRDVAKKAGSRMQGAGGYSRRTMGENSGR